MEPGRRLDSALYYSGARGFTEALRFAFFFIFLLLRRYQAPPACAFLLLPDPACSLQLVKSTPCPQTARQPIGACLRSKCVMETARREVPRASRNLDSRSAPAHASRTTQRTLVQPRAPVPALLAAVSLTVFSTKAKGPATIIPSYRHPYRPTLDESHLGHPAPVAATTHNGQPTKTGHGGLSSTARR